MKKILLIFILLINLNYCFCQSWVKLSKDIKECQINITNNSSWINTFFIEKFYDSRKSLSCMEDFNISLENDTIFILEYHGESGDLSCFSLIWNKYNNIFYSDYGDGRKCGGKSMIPKYIINLVNRWEIEEIKKGKNNKIILPISYVYATRIIFRNKKYNIECFRFEHFRKMDEDEFDIYY